jgi:hypothetical protein
MAANPSYVAVGYTPRPGVGQRRRDVLPLADGMPTIGRSTLCATRRDCAMGVLDGGLARSKQPVTDSCSKMDLFPRPAPQDGRAFRLNLGCAAQLYPWHHDISDDNDRILRARFGRFLCVTSDRIAQSNAPAHMLGVICTYVVPHETRSTAGRNT